MSEIGDWGDARAHDERARSAAGAPREEPGSDVAFIASPRPTTPLAETALYQPGALVALVFLVPPAASALVLTALIWSMGSAPIWLPLTLLLWIPLMVAGWAMLRGVRLTREEIAFGRPLRAWQAIPLTAIECLEAHGPRLTLVITSGRRVSFTPALLRRGAQLRRRLLLSLPIHSLVGEAREEAQRLTVGGALQDGEATDTLTVRPRRWLVGLAAGLACALAGGAMIAWMFALPWIALGPGALALFSLAACLWLAQEVFISERGVSVRFALPRVTRSVSWDELIAIERAPGEVALILRGPRALVCAGPRLLSARDARRMRETLRHYVLERGTPVTPSGRR